MAENKRPPYTSERDLDRLFERMRTIGDPGKIDRKWIESFSLAESQPEAVLSALRWLNVIDKDGESQGAWNDLRLPNTRSATLKRLMEEAYSDVFSTVDVAQADRQDLEGAFISAYGSGDPGRQIKCFLTLSRHAGIEAKAASSARQPRNNGARRASTSKPRQSAPRREKASESNPRKQRRADTSDSPSVMLTLNVEIPAEWTEDQVRERIAVVRRAAETE